MPESYSYIYNEIDFEQILLVCSPLKKCMEYKKIVNMVLDNSDYIYVHIETFMDEFIEALHSKSVDKFKQKYTTCKLLFLRDIHFLSNKTSTQEEIYNIIRTRIENNLKTVIISSISSEELTRTLSKGLYELISLEHINDDFISPESEIVNASPYNGDKNYIFISYSHKNSKQVLEVISRLQKDGYRIWYDEGIDPGTEWDEFIAQKIENSGFFISFISEEYLDSNNCRDELNYARDLDKGRLLVYLTDVKLAGGMAMRLNRLQAIHKYTYPHFDDFIIKLESSPSVENFKD